MKRIFYLPTILIATSIFLSCSNNDNKKAVTKEKVIKETCYISTYENDTATMEILYLNNFKIKGKLKILYGNGAQNNGSIEGKFTGDTLFVDYRFSTANLSLGGFTNPLVFLRKKDQLIMGIGQIETTLGRSYFVKGLPLNFERSKFIFNPTTCK
jgi:hypothetical protein